MRADSRRQLGILSVIFLFLAILSACGDKSQSGYEAPEVSESSDQEEASGSEPAEESEEEASGSEPAEETQQAVPFQGDCTSTTVGTLIDPDEWLYLPVAGAVVAVVGRTPDQINSLTG